MWMLKYQPPALSIMWQGWYDFVDAFSTANIIILNIMSWKEA